MNRMTGYLLVAVVCAAGVGRAQVASATLTGTVTDPSGAAVNGASIRAEQKATGFIRSGATNLRGQFVFEGLAPGTYSVSAHKDGFRDAVAEGVSLAVNQTSNQNFQLIIGSSHDSVTVTATLPVTEPGNATLGYSMNSSRIQELPLESRNVAALVTLDAAAIPRQLGGFVHDVNNDVQEGSRGSVALNPPINGGRSTMNAFLLDGAYDTDRNTFAIAVYPPMDSVREFHIQSSLAPAEFPQAGGGAIDVVTKSGTKTLAWRRVRISRQRSHRCAQLFRRPDAAAARSSGRTSSEHRWAGPCRCEEHLLLWRLRRAAPEVRECGVEPGARCAHPRAGISPDRTSFTIRARRVRARHFPAMRIPQNRLDPIAQEFLAKYEPLPNSNSAAGNYLDATPNPIAHRSRFRPHRSSVRRERRTAHGALHAQQREAIRWPDRSRCCPSPSRCARNRRPWHTLAAPASGWTRRASPSRGWRCSTCPRAPSTTTWRSNWAWPIRRPIRSLRAAVFQRHRLFDGDRFAHAAAGAARQPVACHQRLFPGARRAHVEVRASI